jgi:hypothetical protein
MAYNSSEKQRYVINSINPKIVSVYSLNITPEALPMLSEYREETIVQCSRLYAANYVDEETYLMASDADMMPLSNYWEPQGEEILCYGKDLSDTHQPLCYVLAKAKYWKYFMNLTGNSLADMKRDLDLMPNAKSKNKQLSWLTDQDILTQKISECDTRQIPRGTDIATGYPIGRIDRSAWDKSLKQPLRIDAHLLRPATDESNFYKTLALIKECLNPDDDEIDFLIHFRETYLCKM